ncbi:hypothetical protein ABPG75_010573 [Micractinium tetrahymenae]
MAVGWAPAALLLLATAAQADMLPATVELGLRGAVPPCPLHKALESVFPHRLQSSHAGVQSNPAGQLCCGGVCGRPQHSTCCRAGGRGWRAHAAGGRHHVSVRSLVCEAAAERCFVHRLAPPCLYGRCSVQAQRGTSGRALQEAVVQQNGSSLLTASTLSQARLAFQRHASLLQKNDTAAAWQAFLEWQVQHGIEYGTVGAQARAFLAFLGNIQAVARKLQEPGLTYVPGLTKFSDLAPEEFRRRHLSSIAQPDPVPSKAATPYVSPLAVHAARRLVGAAAAAFDWRDHDKVTPVKDQQACGACWAFAGAGVIESFVAIQRNLTLHISEQQMTSCTSCPCYVNPLIGLRRRSCLHPQTAELRAFMATLKVARAGCAQFQLMASGSARLLVRGAWVAAVNPSGPLANTAVVRTGAASLAAGSAPLVVEWAVGSSTSQTHTLKLLWKPPGAATWQALPLVPAR